MTDENWRLVTVAGVRLELPGIHPEVLLQESEEPRRQVRIPVGFAEGTAIAYAWRGLTTPRPLTHELLSELLDVHGADVAALRITGRQGTVFVAELDTTGPRGRHTVSCRPSDGLALVLRRKTATPILVAESLLSDEQAPPGAGRDADSVPERA
ncbi:MAG TPA: bifunctional nuclease family protein [Acidimicrobiales bacterium]|nr:bifunctional nuclease family protein [Acidimicrobiales bacterium]